MYVHKDITISLFNLRALGSGPQPHTDGNQCPENLGPRTWFSSCAGPGRTPIDTLLNKSTL